MEENEVLGRNNQKLADALSPLKSKEQALNKVAKKNGASVHQLKRLVKENQDCIEESRKVIRDDIITGLMTTLLDTTNDDPNLSERDIKRLCSKWKHDPNVVFDAKKFEKLAKKTPKVSMVMDLIVDAGDESIPTKRQVFRIDTGI